MVRLTVYEVLRDDGIRVMKTKRSAASPENMFSDVHRPETTSTRAEPESASEPSVYSDHHRSSYCLSFE